MKFGLKIAAASLMAFTAVACQTTSKAVVDEPGTVRGFAHFDKEGSVSAKITNSSIQLYKGKKQTFVRDGECENFNGASGVICYKRASNSFMQGGKKIGRFAPFQSNKPKKVATVTQPTAKAETTQPVAASPATAETTTAAQ